MFGRGTKRAAAATTRRRFVWNVEHLEPRQMLDGGGMVDSGPPVDGEMVPDFALVDVNSTSPTHGKKVSPRDYVGQISGWYFGHAT